MPKMQNDTDMRNLKSSGKNQKILFSSVFSKEYQLDTYKLHILHQASHKLACYCAKGMLFKPVQNKKFPYQDRDFCPIQPGGPL